MRLNPTAECNANRWTCRWQETFENWKEARRAAVAHHKATGHLVRVDHIRTELIGLANEDVKEGQDGK